LKELDAEEIRLEKEIEARVSELVKTKLDVVKSTIEQSIVKLDRDKKDIEAKQLYITYFPQVKNTFFRHFLFRLTSIMIL